MEHAYFNIDSVPSDIWRLIFKQLRTLTELRSFNSINKSCHNYSKYYMQKQKIWLGLYKERFGLVDETNFIPSILPSKLFQPQYMLRPPCNIAQKCIDEGPLKIVIIGDGLSGKTTYTNLVATGEGSRNYLPTIGCDLNSFKAKSLLNGREFDLVLWDTAGGERHGIFPTVGRKYYVGAVGAIILSDVNRPNSITNTSNWLQDIRHDCGNIPVAICVNKVDLHPENASPTEVTDRFINAANIAIKNRAMFCEISNWAVYNVHEPLIWILQQLTGDANLELQFPPIIPSKNNRLFHYQNKTVDLNVLNAALKARKEIAKRKQQLINEVLQSVNQSCSPRVKPVMESLLTGVRLEHVINTTKALPLQKPSLLFVEGLECNEFHSIDKFNFVQPFLEFYKQHEDAIIMETKKLMSNSGLDDTTSSVKTSSKSIYLIDAGKICQKTSSDAPILAQLLQTVPSLMTCSFGYAYISILGPHSHITPHHGPCNIKLRYHLQLIVPNEGCTMRVGTITKSFKQGELLIFDDSLEHEVCNDSDSSRVVLLFDIWHPDLTSDEINSFKRYFW